MCGHTYDQNLVCSQLPLPNNYGTGNTTGDFTKSPLPGVIKSASARFDYSGCPTLGQLLQIASLQEPLAERIDYLVRDGKTLFADDTPLETQVPGLKRTKTARVWTYVRGERSWAGPSPPCAWYPFTIDRE
ncbi:MAG: transposase [Lysobacterales bacterium]